MRRARGRRRAGDGDDAEPDALLPPSERGPSCDWPRDEPEYGISCPFPRDRGYRALPVARRSVHDDASLRWREPGPESVSDAERDAWVSGDPFVREGLSMSTQRAMAYITRFAPRRDWSSSR
jgi:hypothetical protein